MWTLIPPAPLISYLASTIQTWGVPVSSNVSRKKKKIWAESDNLKMLRGRRKLKKNLMPSDKVGKGQREPKLVAKYQF
jgi:hypothetical protein